MKLEDMDDNGETSKLINILVGPKDQRDPTIALIGDRYPFNRGGVRIPGNPPELGRLHRVFHQKFTGCMGAFRGQIPGVRISSLGLVVALRVAFNLQGEMVGESGDLPGHGGENPAAIFRKLWEPGSNKGRWCRSNMVKRMPSVSSSMRRG